MAKKPNCLSFLFVFMALWLVVINFNHNKKATIKNTKSTCSVIFTGNKLVSTTILPSQASKPTLKSEAKANKKIAFFSFQKARLQATSSKMGMPKSTVANRFIYSTQVCMGLKMA